MSRIEFLSSPVPYPVPAFAMVGLMIGLIMGLSRPTRATPVPGEAEVVAGGPTEPQGDDPYVDVTDRPPTGGERAPAVSPSAQHEGLLPFADHLFLDGDYYRAITEYRRYLFAVRGRGVEAKRAALAIGEALLRGEQWDAAGRQFDGVAQRTTEAALRQTALFGAGRAYLLDGRPEFAKPRFRILVQDEGTPATLRHESMWLLAWGHFDAGEYDVANTYFAEVAQSRGTHADDAAGVTEALSSRSGLEQKDPVLAGALSLIPGLGHFYLGRYGVGLTSLTWNAVFITALVHAFITGQWGVGIVLTAFELGWYAGGIFGAVSGAVRHNRDVVKNWRDDILHRYGATRELPPAHFFDQRRQEAPPGSLIRLGGEF